MTDDELNMEKSLLRCTIKKSWTVSKKIGLWIGGVAVVLIAGYCAWLGLTSQIAATIWTEFVGWCASSASIVTGIVTVIPWEIWAVIVALVAIFAYSLVWCIARSLIDEDWGSGLATDIAIWLWLMLGMVLVIGLGVWLGLVLGMVLGLSMRLWDTKVFRFLGAYLHYRERMKKEQGGN